MRTCIEVDNHASDRIYEAEMAVKDGMMTSLRFKVVDDYGAYFQFGVGHHGNAMAQAVGPCQINSIASSPTSASRAPIAATR